MNGDEEAPLSSGDLKDPLLPSHDQIQRSPSFHFSLKTIFTPNNLYILLGPLLCAVICVCVKFDGPTTSRNMLAVLAWIFAWWLTEAVPMPITSMAPLFLFPLFGISSSDTVAHSYMDDVISLVLGSFILALAVEHYNIHRRLALNITMLFCGEPLNPQMLLLGICGTTAFVSMWMHNVAAAVMMMPVATGILQNLPDRPLQSDAVRKYCKAVVLGVIYSACKPGAWALDAEEHEDELQQQQEEKQNNTEIADFPSLAAAAATKTKKKNKGQTFSLADFNSASVMAVAKPKGLTHEDLLALPTGPRQRSAEELDRSRLGGGFKNYGSNNRSNSGDDSSNSRWGSGGSSRFSNRESNTESQPSRADEVDNWAAAKKSVTQTGRSGGGFFDSQSKADESGSWFSNKTETTPRSRFGFERKSSFDSLSRDRDNWGRKKDDSNNVSEELRERPRLVLQPRTVPVSEGGVSPAVNAAKPKGANPFGVARPREEVLAEKGKDCKEIDEKLEAMRIKEETTDTTSFGRRGFGNGRGRIEETRTWRKNESDLVDATQRSAENGQAEEKSDNGYTEEN